MDDSQDSPAQDGQNDDQEEDNDAQNGDEQGDETQDGDQGGDLDGLVQVLTVTARRLASVKLGRKFSGNKVSPSELKKKTACVACGEIGHWRGDPQCKVSGSGAATSTSTTTCGPSTTTPAKEGGKGDKPRPAFTVMRSYEVRSGLGTAFGDHAEFGDPGS